MDQTGKQLLYFLLTDSLKTLLSTNIIWSTLQLEFLSDIFLINIWRFSAQDCSLARIHH